MDLSLSRIAFCSSIQDRHIFCPGQNFSHLSRIDFIDLSGIAFFPSRIDNLESDVSHLTTHLYFSRIYGIFISITYKLLPDAGEQSRIPVTHVHDEQVDPS